MTDMITTPQKGMIYGLIKRAGLDMGRTGVQFRPLFAAAGQREPMMSHWPAVSEWVDTLTKAQASAVIGVLKERDAGR